MTLHEAIVQVLVKNKKSMSPIEIADELNKTSWYTKKDGSLIKSSQIGARVKNYSHLFTKNDSLISLKNSTGNAMIKATVTSKLKYFQPNLVDTNLACKVLMNEKNYKSVARVKELLPSEPGLYCIRVKDISVFKGVFNTVLKIRQHNIIYIGIASKSIQKRLSQELWAKGHGTFFRSLGAVLGYTPEEGSLTNKKNQNNYRFSIIDEAKIIQWIESNLLVNWQEVEVGLNEIELDLINQYEPLLNLAGNPKALKELTALRDNCKHIARG